MASVVMDSFREELRTGLTAAEDEAVRASFASGPSEREPERALMLADRAIRRWVGGAIAEVDPTAENHLEALGQLGKPEHGHDADGAAKLIIDAHPDKGVRSLARSVRAVAQAMPEIEDLASNELNQEAFEAVGRAAARCLLAAADIRGRDWLVSEADNAVREIAVLRGWVSQLAPETRQPPGAS